jgi:hypothetical protein
MAVIFEYPEAEKGLLSRDAESGLDLGGYQRELRGIFRRGLRQNLAVQSDSRQFQPVHELAVRKPGFARGGADTDYPERPEIALLALAACVGKFEGALDSFLCGAVQFALG